MTTPKVLVLLMLPGCCGCDAFRGVPTHEPITKIRIRKGLFAGAYVYDSKDNSLGLESMVWNNETQSFEIRNLQFKNDATTPMLAFVQQQQSYLQGMELINQRVDRIMGSIENLASSLAPLAGQAMAARNAGKEPPAGFNADEIVPLLFSITNRDPENAELAKKALRDLGHAVP